MEWKPTFEEIDFNDGQLQEIQITAGDVVVTVELWNAQKVSIRFTDYLSLIDKGAVTQDIASFEVAVTSDFLHNTLSQAKVQADMGEYKHFRFVESWHALPVLEIVSRDVTLQE